MITSTLRLINKLFLRPYRPKEPPSKTVAIVVPLSSRPELTPDEKISLRHLQHYLGDYDKYLIVPRGSSIEIEGCKRMPFSRKYFGSPAAHVRLLFDPRFYRKFADYRYIFFYHLDAVAFSDQTLEWCDKDYDYIGAPWFHCEDSPWVEEPRVGNGGFALLKTESALEVLHNRYLEKPGTYWLDLFARNGRRLRPVIWLLQKLKPLFPQAKWINSPLHELWAFDNCDSSGRHIDAFWADNAVNYLPEFKVAPFEEGLRFAFEVEPRKCLEMNGGKMPFGCHAWGRYDREFWEPYLLKADTLEGGTERNTATERVPHNTT